MAKNSNHTRSLWDSKRLKFLLEECAIVYDKKPITSRAEIDIMIEINKAKKTRRLKCTTTA